MTDHEIQIVLKKEYLVMNYDLTNLQVNVMKIKYRLISLKAD